MVALSIIMIDETRRRPGAPVLSSFVFLDTTRSKRPGAPVLSSFVFLDRTDDNVDYILMAPEAFVTKPTAPRVHRWAGLHTIPALT